MKWDIFWLNGRCLFEEKLPGYIASEVKYPLEDLICINVWRIRIRVNVVPRERIESK